MSSKRLTKEILEEMKLFRQKGSTYKEISIKFNISKGTICYHLAPGLKEKTRIRCYKRREQKFVRKVDLFFDKFNNMPFWYQALFIGVVSAIYGLKGADIIKRK